MPPRRKRASGPAEASPPDHPAPKRSLRARGEERTFYGEFGTLDKAGEDKTSAAFRLRLEAGAVVASGGGGRGSAAAPVPLYKMGVGDLVEGVAGKDMGVGWAREHGLSRPMRWPQTERAALGITVPGAKGFGPRQVKKERRAI
jgi:hypothetical protein